MTPTRHVYVIALGSNIYHPRHGSPPRVLRAALRALAGADVQVLASAAIVASAPVGPSLRRYANGAALIQTALDPLALLDGLQRIETAFGRTRRGQRWRARTLDCDIIMWNGGTWHDRRLTIPHPEFRHRHFVTAPVTQIAPDWRDPATGLKVKHLHARLTHRARAPKGPFSA